jgi:hypothetical protein
MNELIPHADALSVEAFEALPDKTAVSANQVCGIVLWCSPEELTRWKIAKEPAAFFKSKGALFTEPLFLTSQIRTFRRLNPERFDVHPSKEILHRWRKKGGRGNPVLLWKEAKPVPKETNLYGVMTCWHFSDGITINQKPKALTVMVQEAAKNRDAPGQWNLNEEGKKTVGGVPLPEYRSNETRGIAKAANRKEQRVNKSNTKKAQSAAN